MKSIRPGVFKKKSVLKNSTKLTGKHLCWSLFHNKLPDRRHKTKHVHITLFLYEQLGSGHSPQSCLYFQGFWGLKVA